MYSHQVLNGFPILFPILFPICSSCSSYVCQHVPNNTSLFLSHILWQMLSSFHLYIEMGQRDEICPLTSYWNGNFFFMGFSRCLSFRKVYFPLLSQSINLLALPTEAKDIIVFRFIIEYSSLRDFL
jgi:hypothetical protein